MGLNDSYSTIRSKVFMMKPLSDVDIVYDKLINDESQDEIHNPTSSFNSDSATFSTRVQKPHSQKLTLNKTKRSPLVCKYCKKTGHLIDKCINVHGFPLGLQSKFKKAAAFA